MNEIRQKLLILDEKLMNQVIQLLIEPQVSTARYKFVAPSPLNGVATKKIDLGEQRGSKLSKVFVALQDLIYNRTVEET